jgi:integrase
VEVKGSDAEGEISCMTPEMAGHLLETTRRVRPSLLWFPVLGLFPFIRSKELRRLQPADVDLAQRLVVVGSWLAKGRMRRVVPLSANAVRWLRLWQREGGGEMKFSRYYWDEVRVQAGWRVPQHERLTRAPTREGACVEWPRNILRHTGASMHYAAHGDERALKTMMGHHASEDTLHRHYRAVRLLDGRIITPAVARRFWGLSPRQ